ncbi:hypothetical protein HZS_2634 [Henneguya salminicola]|nr:hypothetical protein HZS_2634 [Henneguya salminicola]
MAARDYEPDAIYTLEGQFIIRFPEKYSLQIDEAIEDDTISNRLSIEMDIWGDVKFYGKVVDLPCIIESNKSIDCKSIYKTGDISQMLICSLEPFSESRDTNLAVIPGGWTAKKFLWPHGLTPPLKNVRTRRFRKIQKKKVTDYSDVEKELRRLIQADISAESVELEEIREELDKKSSDPHQIEEDQDAAINILDFTARE